MTDRLAALLHKLDLQEEHGGDLNEARELDEDGKVILCKEATNLTDDPQYIFSVANLKRETKKCSENWQGSAKDLIELQFGTLPYSTLRCKVDKGGVLTNAETSSGSLAAILDFNHEVARSLKEPTIALISNFVSVFVADFISSYGGGADNIPESILSSKQAELLKVVGNEQVLNHAARAALRGLWESGRTSRGGKGAKEALMKRLRDWMDSNHARVFTDMVMAVLNLSFGETQKLVHFITISNRHGQIPAQVSRKMKPNHAAEKKEPVTRRAGASKTKGLEVDVIHAAVQPAGKVEDAEVDVMDFLIRKEKEKPAVARKRE